MAPGLPTGTVTFLFTDVEGSTRALEELGPDAYGAALERHRAVVRAALAAHGGVELDTQGDSFFCVFALAEDAVAAAAAMQGGLRGGGLRVRMGLHSGEAAVTADGSYLGLEVHRAARIGACGHGGQVVVSDATAALLPPHAPALGDLGVHRLKDLSAPLRLYQLGDEGFPPLRTLRPTRLPVPPTGFVGRERELVELSALAEPGRARVLTLTGPGGAGKTRLALQLAGEIADRFPDGVAWVPLAPLRDPALVLPAVAQALEADDEPGLALEEAVARAAWGRSLLLLDNCEHVLAAAARLVSALAARCPDLLVLVTSRERLDVAGEHVYPVPPLAEADAELLFAERALAHDPSFAPSPGLAELCRRLEQLPLALELAAARTRLFSASQLLDRLSDRLDLLAGPRDADPRQRTLRATLDWSYELLTPSEQASLRALSVFAGGCTLDTAEAVAGAGPDVLQSLLDKSLVSRRDDSPEPRFWMLETVRQYAAEALAGAGEERAAVEALSTHFLALAEQAFEERRGPEGRGWLDRLEADHANLRAALQAAVSGGDAAAAERFVRALGFYWYSRGSVPEAEELVASVLALPASGDRALRGVVYDRCSQLASMRGDYDRAEGLGRQAVSLLEQAGDLEGAAVALSNLGGSFAFAPGRLHESVALLERAIALMRRLPDPWMLVAALLNLGNALLGLERYADAEAAYAEGGAVAEARGDARWAASARLGVAECALWRGHAVRAADLLLPVVREALATGARDTLLNALDLLAVAEGEAGGDEQAVRLRAAVDAAVAVVGHRLDPLLDERRDAARHAAASRLGERAGAIAAAGAALTLEEAARSLGAAAPAAPR